VGPDLDLVKINDLAGGQTNEAKSRPGRRQQCRCRRQPTDHDQHDPVSTDPSGLPDRWPSFVVGDANAADVALLTRCRRS
jgi:hypothetical protein